MIQRVQLWTPALVLLVLLPGSVLAQGRRCVVSEVRISPADAAIRPGQTATFLPDAFNRDGQICTEAIVIWSSNNVNVARVDANGIVTALNPGTAVITATTGTGALRRSGQAVIQVVSAIPPILAQGGLTRRPLGPGCAAWDRQPYGTGVPVTISISPSLLQLVRGEQRQLAYYSVDENARPASSVCIVFDVYPATSRVASVDSFGVVTAGADTGRVSVMATIQDPRAQVRMRRMQVVVSSDSVRFRDAAVSMSPNTTDTLRIIVPAQQSRILNPRGVFLFQSSNSAVARVGFANGVVKALAPGTARITAESHMYPSMSVVVNVHARVRHLEATPAESVITLALGSVRRLSARALAEDSSPVPQVPLRWRGPDGNVVQWDSVMHIVRGLRVGETSVAVEVPFGRDSPLLRSWRIRVVAGNGP